MTKNPLETTPDRPKGRPFRLFLKIIGGLVAVIVLAALALSLTFLPARLDLPAIEVGDLPPAAPPAEMSISALPTGTYDAPGFLAYRGGPWTETFDMAATALLVRHPKGNLLIDTGLGTDVDDQMKLLPAMEQSRHDKGIPAVDQLKAENIAATDIMAILPTHPHWDHISGLADFPGVPVLQNAEGRDFATSNAKGTEVLNSIPNIHFMPYDYEGGPYLGFAKSHDVFGDGAVVIVPAPGHTPDSIVVFVNLPSGARYAMVGDLVWQMEGLDIPAERPWLMRWLIGENYEQLRHEIALVRAATQKFPQLHAIPAHDTSAFATIATFPNVTR
jgi:N-acyl homoserine lactone hydrolase